MRFSIRQSCFPAVRRAWPLFAVVALLSGGPAHADDWPSPGLDAAHTRLSAERSGITFGDGHWSFTPSGRAMALASPVVSDGYVVSAALDGTVTALAADTGRVAWQVVLGPSVQGTPAIANGRVFVPTLGSKIVALALADGGRLWSTTLGGLNVSSPAVVNGDLIVGAGLPEQFVARLDGATGAIVWRTPAGMEEFSNTPPAVAGGLVVVGTNGGHYYAFDATTGLPRWDYRADGIVNLASPLIFGGRVYMAGGQESDHVHAVDAATGVAIAGWPITLPTPAPDLQGTESSHRRSVSSFASVGGLVVLETRLDDAIDSDGDGLPDQILSRESVLALDPSSGAIAWEHPTARQLFPDADDVPGFVVCPTPAAFATGAGTWLLAAQSSLAGTVSILEASSGHDDGDIPVSGRALASPVMANGRLVTVSENGVVEAHLSTVNHPPTAPVLAANPQPLDSADVTLRWAASMDLDGDQPTYELRLDTDDEVLMSYAQQIFPAQGTTSVAITAPLSPGVTYTVAVRARDAHGALSSWSAPETFTVATAGPVSVNGVPATNLRGALAAAVAGDVVLLGAGTFPISQPLQVDAGVTLRGAGAGRTTIDATGLAVGVGFSATNGKTPATLDGATVVGAATCVAVAGDATGVQLTHLVLRDCVTAGVTVSAGGDAELTNVTVVGNGTGVDSSGAASIKNSLLTGNEIALRAAGQGTLISSYDDLFGNTTDYQGLKAGTGDLAAAVTFVDLAGHDLRLSGPQPSTDQGDPADPVGDEPTPNGARINLGAFGGTADAELSVPAPVADDGGVATPTPVPTQSTSTTLAPGDPVAGRVLAPAGGCAFGGGAPGTNGWTLLAALAGLSLVLVRSRRRMVRTRR